MCDLFHLLSFIINIYFFIIMSNQSKFFNMDSLFIQKIVSNPHLSKLHAPIHIYQNMPEYPPALLGG